MTTSVDAPDLPVVEGVEHRFVDVDGVSLHVATAGAGEPLVLLHGWPQHWWLWRNLIGPLSEQYEVFAPDLRGFGWSDVPEHGYDKRSIARELLRLLDVLEIDRPVRLMGHDWGGFCGFIMCMLEPERFERYMALNIPPPWAEPSPRPSGDGPAARVSSIAGLVGNRLRLASRLWYQVVLSTPGVNGWALNGGGRPRFADGIVRSTDNRAAWSDGALDVFLNQFDDPRRVHATMQLYRTFLLRELPALARGEYLDERLTVPSRILFGVNDPAIGQSSITADHSRHADDLTAELVPNCSHFIVDEQPELVLDRALEWFSR